MYIIVWVFYVAGIVSFIDAIFIKYDVWNWIEGFAYKMPAKVLFNLLSCQFCIKFHIGWVVTGVLSLLFGFNLSVLTVPFLSSGFIHLITKR